MKCLWVEDFSFNNNVEEEKGLRDKYDLLHEDVVLKTSLTDALAYIDQIDVMGDDYDKIDAVILDISLTIGDKVNDRDYKDYLKGVVSEEYLERDKENVGQVGGFYIFLKLILDKGFPRDRIAILTSNYQVDEANIALDNVIRYLKRYSRYDKFQEVEKRIMDNKSASSENTATNKEIEIYNYMKIIKDIDSANIGVLEEHLKGDINSLIIYLDKLRSEINKDKEVGNAYNQYVDIFESAGIKPPIAFLKDNEEHIEKFKKWKKGQNNDYYILRRGIIEICRELKKRLRTEKEEFILFNKFMHNKTSKEKREMFSVQYFQEMLSYLQYIFPTKEPIDKSSIYRQIIRIISHDWESAYAVYPHSFQMEKYQKNLCTIMKLLRNWTAHSKIRDEFTSADVGFLFIIAMRTFFNIECRFENLNEGDFSKISYYEKTLLQLGSKKISNEELVSIFTEEENGRYKLYYILSASFNEITKREYLSYGENEKWKWSESVSFNVYKKLETIGNNSSKINVKINDLYRMLWHSIFYSKWKEYNGESDNYTSLEVDFHIINLNTSILEGDNIIYELLKSTYMKFIANE